MKIIGESSSDHYIAVVNKDEIEKVFNKFYGKLPPIKVGDTINIAQGHDFCGEIQRVCNAMQDSMKAFERARATLQQFAMMVAEHGQNEGEQK